MSSTVITKGRLRSLPDLNEEKARKICRNHGHILSPNDDPFKTLSEIELENGEYKFLNIKGVGWCIIEEVETTDNLDMCEVYETVDHYSGASYIEFVAIYYNGGTYWTEVLEAELNAN